MTTNIGHNHNVINSSTLFVKTMDTILISVSINYTNVLCSDIQVNIPAQSLGNMNKLSSKQKQVNIRALVKSHNALLSDHNALVTEQRKSYSFRRQR